MATDATPEKKFTVSDHALQQYRKRYPGRLSRKALEAEIYEHVSQGIAAGHVLRRKPDAFRLYAEKRKDLPAGRRFVYRHPDASVGFVIAREPQEDIVVTTLTRSGVHR